MVLKHTKNFFNFYSLVHHKRKLWFSWKWRVFCVLLAIAIILIVQEYLELRYLLPATDLLGKTFLLSERLFYWFMTGTLFGIITLAVIYEGEFILGLRRVVKHMERQGVGTSESRTLPRAKQTTRKKR